MRTFDKTKLSIDVGDQRRASILTVSDAGSEFEHRKKIKYGGPLAGSELDNVWSPNLKTFSSFLSCLGVVC